MTKYVIKKGDGYVSDMFYHTTKDISLAVKFDFMTTAMMHKDWCETCKDWCETYEVIAIDDGVDDA